MEKPTRSLISYFSSLTSRSGGINLAQGKPGFPPPAKLLRLLREKSRIPALHQYAPGDGHEDLLELIARRYSVYTPIQKDNLVIVQGATEGIFLALFYLNTILTAPYSILSFDPVYESYPELARFLGRPFVYADFEPDLSLDFKKLENTIRKEKVRVVLLASPGNPLGRIWNQTELDRMIELSRRLDFYLVFDGVYLDIYHREPAHLPLTGVPENLRNSRLIFVSSFSKTLSITGWRIGFMIADDAHMKRIRAIHDYTGLSAPSLFQAAISEYCRKTDFGRDYLNRIRKQCRESYALMKNALERLGFQIPEIRGGYFLWARLPSKYPDGFQFSLNLLKQHRVGVVPGENFSPKRRDHIRINIAAPLPVVKEGAGRIEAFCRQTNR